MTSPPARNASTTVRSRTTTPPPSPYAARRAADVWLPPSGPGSPASAAPAAVSSTTLTAASSRRNLRPPAARHRDAELLLRGIGRELAGDAALVDHDDPVGERANLLGLERHQQDAAAGVALGDEPAMDELDRADVEAAGRLRRHPDAGGVRDLARADDLLVVAARQRGRHRLGLAVADVELADERARGRDHPPRRHEAA